MKDNHGLTRGNLWAAARGWAWPVYTWAFCGPGLKKAGYFQPKKSHPWPYHWQVWFNFSGRAWAGPRPRRAARAFYSLKSIILGQEGSGSLPRPCPVRLVGRIKPLGLGPGQAEPGSFCSGIPGWRVVGLPVASWGTRAPLEKVVDWLWLVVAAYDIWRTSWPGQG
jgi:hypothetical protein